MVVVLVVLLIITLILGIYSKYERKVANSVLTTLERDTRVNVCRLKEKEKRKNA